MAEEGMDLFAMPASADWSKNDMSKVDQSNVDMSTMGAARPFEPLAQRMRPRNF
jgi:putative ATPase